jgi:hypothetical protein
MSDPEDDPDGHPDRGTATGGSPDAERGSDAEEPPTPVAEDAADSAAGPDPDADSGSADQADEADADDDSEWQFSLQDIRDREAEREAAAEAERRRSEPLEAGDPSLENAVFVLIGVLFALFVISRLFVV